MKSFWKFLIIVVLFGQLVFIRMSCIQWGAQDYRFEQYNCQIEDIKYQIKYLMVIK